VIVHGCTIANWKAKYSKCKEKICNIWNWRNSRPNHLLVSWCWLRSGILPCPCPLIFSGIEKQLAVSGIMKYYEKSWNQLLNPRETREATYIYEYCNIEVCSCNHFWSGNAITITQPECAFVALGMQHAIYICYIVICGLPHSTIFFHVIS